MPADDVPFEVMAGSPPGLQSFVSSADIVMEHALRLAQFGKPAEAIGLVLDVFDHIQDPCQRLVDLALIPHGKQEWFNAWTGWAAVLEFFPDRVIAYISGAEALRGVGRLREVDALLADGVKRMPLEYPLLASFAKNAEADQNGEQIRNRWAAARAAHPVFLDAYLESARALSTLGLFDEADSLLSLEDWPTLNADERQLRSLFCSERATAALLRRDIPRALEMARAVLAHEPGHPRAALIALGALRDLDMWSEADELCSALPDTAFKRLDIMGIWASLAIAVASPTEYISRALQVIQAFPDQPKGYWHAIYAYGRANDREAAEQYIKVSREKFPSDLGITEAEAAYAMWNYFWERAIPLWKLVLAAHPDHPSARQELARAQRAVGSDETGHQA